MVKQAAMNVLSVSVYIGRLRALAQTSGRLGFSGETAKILPNRNMFLINLKDHEYWK